MSWIDDFVSCAFAIFLVGVGIAVFTLSILFTWYVFNEQTPSEKYQTEYTKCIQLEIRLDLCETIALEAINGSE